MYKTPVMERKQRAVTTENSAKTPVGDLSKSVVEPSALNTPEEPGKFFSVRTHLIFKYSGHNVGY